ncbi:hypothetical protein GCK32_015401 [Trichostrongylus colubriformis]|uniref:Uncharacterized protein n=1 Tax=Trichostrongylus colubriformis TaxID=6319 RepID=A0AAN8G5E1_TRICO
MAQQFLQMMGNLEDIIAEKAVKSGKLPFNLSVESSNDTMVIFVGNADYILNKSLECQDWKVVFPSLADLHLTLSEKDDFRAGLWCFERNPFSYLDNYDVLITSGALSVHLKYLNGTDIVYVSVSEYNICGG